MKIENVKKLMEKLRKRRLEAAKGNVVVIVGYTAKYALYVHENREMKLKGDPRPSGLGVYWGPNGRAGFLLDVAREMTPEIVTIVTKHMANGGNLAQALVLAGLRLQRESQLNVPVEYGLLRASAFTRQEGGGS